jgi:hypothetical protein
MDREMEFDIWLTLLFGLRTGEFRFDLIFSTVFPIPFPYHGMILRFIGNGIIPCCRRFHRLRFHP